MPLASEAGLGHSWVGALRGGAGAADSTVLQVPMHNMGLRASQRAGVPGSAEAMGAMGEGEAVPRAWGPGTAKPGGFGVSEVLFSLLSPFPPLCAAHYLPLEMGQQPQGASEDTEDLSTGPKTRARWAGGKSCLPLPTPMSTAGGQALAPRGVGGLGSVGRVLVYPW